MHFLQCIKVRLRLNSSEPPMYASTAGERGVEAPAMKRPAPEPTLHVSCPGGGEGCKMPEVENRPLVNTGHVHTGGHWLRGLGVPLGSFGCMRGSYAGACWRDLWEVGEGAEVTWILSVQRGGLWWESQAGSPRVNPYLTAQLPILRGCKATDELLGHLSQIKHMHTLQSAILLLV